MFTSVFKQFPKQFSLKMAQQQLIKTFAFIDLETTGLPSEEHNKTKITELTLLTVQSNHLALGVVPRVQNKLSMCFNPRKLVSYGSEQITGLNNELLEHFAPFTSETVQMINQFLNHCQKPVCLVAHNGNRFDYPILRTEIEKTGQGLSEDVLCIDSLPAFQELHCETETVVNESTDVPDSVPLEFKDGYDGLLCQAVEEYKQHPNKGLKRALEIQKINETTPKKAQNLLNSNQMCSKLDGILQKQSTDEVEGKKLKLATSRKRLNFGTSFKLADVYKRLTNKEVSNAHQAENDVIMLAMSAAALGDKFIDWSNENATNFNAIPKMVPGKRIGT